MNMKRSPDQKKSLTMPTAMTAALSVMTLASAFVSFPASAQEAAIRKSLESNLKNFPPIQEISKTPVPGIYEVRINDSDLLYTDTNGDFLIQGVIIDVKKSANLTEKRTNELTRIKFSDLDTNNAIKIVNGDGKRKMAVFADPNCSYCKKFEQENKSPANTTMYVFLLPILGADSTQKAKNIWCSKDQVDAWKKWMVNNVAPEAAAASCDTTALTRNMETSRKFKITGTPTIFFADGNRVPGAIAPERLEKMLESAK